MRAYLGFKVAINFQFLNWLILQKGVRTWIYFKKYIFRITELCSSALTFQSSDAIVTLNMSFCHKISISIHSEHGWCHSHLRFCNFFRPLLVLVPRRRCATAMIWNMHRYRCLIWVCKPCEIKCIIYVVGW